MSFSYKNAATETKQFIRKLQRSDEKTKKQWFLGTTSVIMVLVLLLWVVYLNLTIPSVAGPVISTSTPSLAFKPELKRENVEPSIFETFAKGVSVIGNDLKQKYEVFSEAVTKSLNSLKSKFEKKNSMSIQGANLNFTFQGLDKIPPTPLP